MVKPLKVKVPELAIDQPVVAMVMVPDEAVKLPLLPTDNALETEKLEEVVSVDEAATARP